jgi:DNA-binding transcriptional regulator YiaG
MNIHAHDCEASATEYEASSEHPYHYVGSGLANVYLVGVKYWVCNQCQLQSAEIPALKHLLAAIGRTVVEKQSPLTGSQVRYLRKRLRQTQVDFAQMIGLSSQRLCTLEGSDTKTFAEGRDKLVRFIYRDLSGDEKLRTALASGDQIQKWLASIHGRGKSEKIVATWLQNRKWRVEAAPMPLAA